MPTTTPNLGLTKPTPGGDDDVWAPMINGDLDILDTQVPAKVAKAGDTMTGQLTLPVNASPLPAHAARTDAVTAKVAKAGDTMTGQLTLPANASPAASDAARSDAVQAKVAKSGDTMTGALTLSGNPTAGMHAVPRDYLDTGAAARVLRAGDTMTGLLTLSGTPSSAGHAATKAYVDTGDGLAVKKAGDTMTGALTLSGNPTAGLHAVPRDYLDTGAAARVLRGGDTMTGALTLSGPPVQPPHAANRNYVDTQNATRVAKDGDTMTGALQLPGDPTQPLHAVTKQYADARLFTDAPSDGAIYGRRNAAWAAQPAASEAAPGLAEIATLAEVSLGTDATRYITPAALHTALQPVPTPTFSWDASSMVLPAGWTLARADSGSYIDSAGATQVAAANMPRWTHDRATKAFRGILLEDNSSNLVLNSATGANQTVAVTAIAHTLSFVGAGTVSLTGPAILSLVGTGATARVSRTFTPTAGTLAMDVVGDVRELQIEPRDFASSWIPTTSATAVRGRDSLSWATANLDGVNFSHAMRFAPHREGSAIGAGADQVCLVMGPTSATNNSTRITNNANGTWTYSRQISALGGVDYSITPPRVAVPDQFNTHVFAYGGGSAVAVVDGDAPIQAASSPVGSAAVGQYRIPGPTTIASMGMVLASVRRWNGIRLTNQQAQIVAAGDAGVLASFVRKSGDTLTGALQLPADPSAALHAATKQYVDAGNALRPTEAPTDGSYYTRRNAAWTPAPAGSDAIQGLLELATPGEVAAGVDTTRAVTPAALAAGLTPLPVATPFDWDAASLALLPGWTFTRASTGSYFDSAGALQSAAANVPRFTYDPVSKQLRGLLLEDASTNMVVGSATPLGQSVTVAAAPHTISFWGDGFINLSGAFVGVATGTSATKRTFLTFTPAAGSLTLSISGTVSNLQLEAKGFASSYIPTTGAAATRAAELISQSGLSLTAATMSFAVRFAPARDGSDATQAAPMMTLGQGTSINASIRLSGVAGGALNWARRINLTTPEELSITTAAGYLKPDQVVSTCLAIGGGSATMGATGEPLRYDLTVDPVGHASPLDLLRIGAGTGAAPTAGYGIILSRFRLWGGVKLPDAQVDIACTTGTANAPVSAGLVRKAGDTMTGLLTLSGPPTAPLHAATKAYADGALAALAARIEALEARR